MDEDEYDYWNAQAIAARRTQLETVRKAATAWSALLTAVLGVFGTATFVSGLPGLGDLADKTAEQVRALVATIAILLLVAVVMSALASTSVPKLSNDVTAETLRNRTKAKAVSARRLLSGSVAAGGGAAVLLVVGSLTVLYAEKAEDTATATTVLVTLPAGTFCGELEADTDGNLSVGGQPLAGVMTVVVVEECPAGSAG